jgi:hypothetical protein
VALMFDLDQSHCDGNYFVDLIAAQRSVFDQRLNQRVDDIEIGQEQCPRFCLATIDQRFNRRL